MSFVSQRGLPFIEIFRVELLFATNSEKLYFRFNFRETMFLSLGIEIFIELILQKCYIIINIKNNDVRGAQSDR